MTSVWRAIAANGETCYFGEPSFAKAWAGAGIFEEIVIADRSDPPRLTIVKPNGQLAEVVAQLAACQRELGELRVNAGSVVGATEHYFRFPTESNRLTLMQCLESYRQAQRTNDDEAGR